MYFPSPGGIACTAGCFATLRLQPFGRSGIASPQQCGLALDRGGAQLALSGREAILGDMKIRLVRVFLATWFSFALFFSTMLPFLNRPQSQLILRGIIGGFFVATATVLFERWRLSRTALTKPPLNEEL